MAEPFLGELRLMSFNFAPKGWALCNGQILPINQNQALFALFGTMYGGNAQTTFALPDLRGRVPMHVGGALPTQGESAGAEAVTINIQSMPTHFHTVTATSSAGNAADPVEFAQAANAYGPPNQLTTVHPATVTNVGGSQPHTNLQPYLVLNWCVALQGIFPSRN